MHLYKILQYTCSKKSKYTLKLNIPGVMPVLRLVNGYWFTHSIFSHIYTRANLCIQICTSDNKFAHLCKAVPQCMWWFTTYNVTLCDSHVPCKGTSLHANLRQQVLFPKVVQKLYQKCLVHFVCSDSFQQSADHPQTGRGAPVVLCVIYVDNLMGCVLHNLQNVQLICWHALFCSLLNSTPSGTCG